MVSRFVHSGLAAGDRVWCFPNGCRPEVLSWLHHDSDAGMDNGEAMANGQLMVRPTHESVLSVLGSDPATVVDGLRRAVDDALDEGWNGFRVVGDLGWATRGPACVPHLLDFEVRVGEVLAHSPAAALCQYDRYRFDADAMATLAEAHAAVVGAVATMRDNGLSCIPLTHPAPGLRLVGEVDLSNHEMLTAALNTALAGTADLHLELSELEFIDNGGAQILVQAARQLGPDRRLVLHRPPLSLTMALTMPWDAPNLVIAPNPSASDSPEQS